MEKMKHTPTIVVYHAERKDGSTTTGNQLTSVDCVPVTIEQLAKIKTELLKKNKFRTCIFLNIIYLREVEKQGDEEADREAIYKILMDVFANHRVECEGGCISCDYVDRGRCGKLVEAMAKRVCDAGYRKTEGTEERNDDR